MLHMDCTALTSSFGPTNLPLYEVCVLVRAQIASRIPLINHACILVRPPTHESRGRPVLSRPRSNI